MTKGTVEVPAGMDQFGAIRATLQAVQELTGEQFSFQLVEREAAMGTGRRVFERVLQVTRKPRPLTNEEKYDLLALNGGIID